MHIVHIKGSFTLALCLCSCVCVDSMGKLVLHGPRRNLLQMKSRHWILRERRCRRWKVLFRCFIFSFSYFFCCVFALFFVGWLVCIPIAVCVPETGAVSAISEIKFSSEHMFTYAFIYDECVSVFVFVLPSLPPPPPSLFMPNKEQLARRQFCLANAFYLIWPSSMLTPHTWTVTTARETQPVDSAVLRRHTQHPNRTLLVLALPMT